MIPLASTWSDVRQIYEGGQKTVTLKSRTAGHLWLVARTLHQSARRQQNTRDDVWSNLQCVRLTALTSF